MLNWELVMLFKIEYIPYKLLHTIWMSHLCKTIYKFLWVSDAMCGVSYTTLHTLCINPLIWGWWGRMLTTVSLPVTSTNWNFCLPLYILIIHTLKIFEDILLILGHSSNSFFRQTPKVNKIFHFCLNLGSFPENWRKKNAKKKRGGLQIYYMIWQLWWSFSLVFPERIN